MENNEINILVTGASGFLGSRIVEELLAEDSPFQYGRIIAFDRLPYKGIENTRIECIEGDIRDSEGLDKVCKDIDIVIHSAAIIDWGTKSENEVMDINLGGTKNIIHACQKQGVKYLIYTSSLDAVFTGKPLVNINESQAYPESSMTVYCKSKKEAELAVLSQTSKDLNVCVLRPSDIYGEADPYHIDSLIDMAKTGFYIRLGNGKSKCQHVYVGNMAHAHVKAAEALYNGNQKVNNEVYFITDGEGSNFFTFFDQVVSGAGYKIFPKNLWLPRGIAYFIGGLSEFFAWLYTPIKKTNPKFSRFAVVYTCTDFTFSSQKALEHFAYKPKYKVEEAVQRTISYYKIG